MKVLNGYVSGFSEQVGVYIGRAGKGKKSVLANRFRIGTDGTREEVIEKYRKWLWIELKNGNEEIKAELRMIYKGNKNVICFCAPLSCHGDVVIRAAKWLCEES